jgi:excisionase family DNA binding protein
MLWNKEGDVKRRAERNKRPAQGALTVSDVARRLRVSSQHVIDLIEQGMLHAVDMAGRGASRAWWRIPREALEQFKAQKSNMNVNAGRRKR